jgi:hypothetical protein
LFQIRNYNNNPGPAQEQVQQSYHSNPVPNQARERFQPSGYQSNYQGNNQQGYNQGYNRGYYNNHSNENWRRSQNNANTVPIGSSHNQNAFRPPPPQHLFNQGQSQPQWTENNQNVNNQADSTRASNNANANVKTEQRSMHTSFDQQQ